MANAIALTIGLNSVSASHYGGWSGPLNACEADAKDMAAVARSRNFKVTTLLTRSATRARVTTEISKGAKALKAGDIFLLTYAGHGGQLPDINQDEEDMLDETWCLYDGELVDDELYFHLGKFAKGVRVLVLIDCCHSGTVVRSAFPAELTEAGHTAVRFRNMPNAAARSAYQANKTFYDKILSNPKFKNTKKTVKASVLLISGCQDNQLAADGDSNGLFTANILRVWKDGGFKGSYKSLHRAIVKKMPANQTPMYIRVGPMDEAFETQRPFSV